MIITMKELKPRRPFDHYPTPRWLVDAALGLIQEEPTCICDAGAGNGVWGEAARERWPVAFIAGVEVRDIEPHPAYAVWHMADFAEYGRQLYGIDLVMGNPPYSQAEAFVRAARDCLGRGGEVLFLLRLSFLESQRRRDGLFRDFPPKLVAVCSKRPGFNTDNNRTNATAFALFLWQRGWRGRTEVTWL